MIKIPLNNHFAQVTSITLNQEDGEERFEGLNISHTHCQARVSLYGGQVLSFKPTGHKDVLWLSERASYQKGKAIRGGIPLCWPWFGANNKQSQYLAENPNTALKSVNHGFARQLSWQITSIDADESGVTLVLVLSGENQHPLWPNAYTLTQTLFFGKSFKQTLEMSNLSSEAAQYSAALHSYFSVSNPNQVSIDGLTGLRYSDKLTGCSSTQHESVSCVGEIDREYHSGEKMTIVDNNWQRKIDITSSNCQQWVLWNPGAELANTMADIHPQGEQEYVCLEAANTSWQTIPAGKTIIISQEITVTNYEC
jgi:glucose-6-phosphate 1-epimerase